MLSKELIGDFIDAVVDDREKARQMLEASPELKNARWIHNETVLHFLTIEGFSDGVRFLAELGADVNSVDEFGASPLIHSIICGREEIAKVLIACGANVNAQSPNHDNVLFCAIRSGNERLVELMLLAGADHTCITEFGLNVFEELPDGPSRTAIANILRKYGAAERT